MISAIVLDIEGTTSPTDSIRETLYDYTRGHLASWLRAHADDTVIADTRALSGRADADPDEVAEILCGWLDSDVKAAPLKVAQGMVCAEGFRNGDLYGEFFDDVPPALRGWHTAGVQLYVYSSGSVRNQQDWFTYARGGELASLISGWFDLVSAGAKRDVASYRCIAEAIGVVPRRILFLSDHADELDAALAAGWSVVGVGRPGEPHRPRPPHRWVETFARISVDLDSR